MKIGKEAILGSGSGPGEGGPRKAAASAERAISPPRAMPATAASAKPLSPRETEYQASMRDSGRIASNQNWYPILVTDGTRSEEHTSELQSRSDLVCRLLLEKKKQATRQLPNYNRLYCFSHR